ncbi:uncharacterized protein LY79DRAFT_305155 [Colletotrichum navitas]|uniref:Uncharacterized protein n=1 Tax=Colletotrichum navitas TaxID=681940 RepID=A0AAD8PUC6_9PEZI|nr:uncharacterized protein LY79DRAFT_305155 [Colletotrichum navitas]KAK1580380.1 hypothetical protein LY79DRAFT_305155 [Colletotrichum navitas]
MPEQAFPYLHRRDRLLSPWVLGFLALLAPLAVSAHVPNLCPPAIYAPGHSLGAQGAGTIHWARRSGLVVWGKVCLHVGCCSVEHFRKAWAR